MVTRSIAVAAAATLALLAPTTPAAADPGAQMFKRLTDPMPRLRKVQFCAYVASSAFDLAGETADPATRAARAAAAAQLSARLASDLAQANAALSPEDLAAIARENGEAMGLLSYAPSGAVAAQIKAGADVEDIGGLFVSDVLRRCDKVADTLKIAKVAADAVPLAAPAFRWRGLSAGEAFADTLLAPFAAKLCTGAATLASDFAGAPLAQRGVDSVSLLDWAMECGDTVGFAALLAAGFDAAAPGAFDDPIVVAAAEKRDLFYLETLLAAGVKPDTMGLRETALKAAYDTTDAGGAGGGKAWQMLRTAGANLNFPDFDHSMWWSFALYADWEQILAHWSEFGSDPVALARLVSMDLDRNGGPRGNAAALEEIKARLIADYGVCFPVGPTLGAPTDARGYILQPDCKPVRR